MSERRDQRIPLAGYCDPLSARPGDTLGFKLSATGHTPENPAIVSSRLTRCICADPNPAGPGIIERDASSWYPGNTHTVTEQPINAGSSAICTSIPVSEDITRASMEITLWPTLLNGAPQCIMTFGKMTLFISEDNTLRCRVGRDSISGPIMLRERQWYRVSCQLVTQGDSLVCHLTGHHLPDASVSGAMHASAEEKVDMAVEGMSAQALFSSHESLSLAARPTADGFSDHFNGKLEAPALTFDNAARDTAAKRYAWNFSRQMGSCQLDDSEGHGLTLALLNMPARAMKASCWTGEEMCWRHRPEHYAAIHFHDDDLVNMQWATSFNYTLPENIPSGVYIMHVNDGQHHDAIPFFVCAPRDKPTHRVCVLISTFTYAIYGNHARPDWTPQWRDKNERFNAYPYNPAEYPGYGLSTYNYHDDGSGICHASHCRPLMNLRPGYVTFGNTDCSGLRHFQADSHLLAWLDAMNIGVDIITDRELHDDGVDCIAGYDVLLTGTHPEYHTAETLDALTAFRDRGGHLDYLGGNGFYWKIAIHTEQEDVLEIRRAEAGIRAWAAEPGEYYQAFDGQYGGLWRRNGRPPQALSGVGFSAQGQFNGSCYRKKSVDPAYAWVFDGVDGEIIGDFGLSGNGAAGFELDRADTRLGTPGHAVVLASSEGHGNDFILVPEEMLTHLTTLPGPSATELIRADIVFFDVPGGGSVFSVGSITFCGSLPHNRFDNPVSRLLLNVLEHQLSRQQ